MKIRDYHRKQAIHWQKAADKAAYWARDAVETFAVHPGNFLDREAVLRDAVHFQKFAADAAEIARHHLFALIDMGAK